MVMVQLQTFYLDGVPVHLRARNSVPVEEGVVWNREADAVPAGKKREGSLKLPSLSATNRFCCFNTAFSIKQTYFFAPQSTITHPFCEDYWMKGRITRKKSPAETIDKTAVINRSRLTSDILIILLSMHTTSWVDRHDFYLPRLPAPWRIRSRGFRYGV